MKRLLVALLLLFILCSCSSAPTCDTQDSACTRVLFIGNSHTFSNDLPNLFAKLARAGDHKVEVGMAAQSGWWLKDHIQSTDTLNVLNSKTWDFVVLQEQSKAPALEPARIQIMYPAVRGFVPKIRELGATPVFFLTWAHRAGWPEYGMMDYESMQSQVDAGYFGIAQELNVRVAPVGMAWSTAVREHPELSLWQEDGSHPSEQGSYLAACVFYAVIFHESPDGLSYRAGLSREAANTLQVIASRIVLNTP